MTEPTLTEIRAGAEAIRRVCQFSAPQPTEAAEIVLSAVLSDHDARIREPYERRIAALQELLEELLACHITGRQPSEALHHRLEETRAALTDTSVPIDAECCGICLIGSDVGVPSAKIAYAYPGCPQHDPID